jgi:hypothetical protein
LDASQYKALNIELLHRNTVLVQVGGIILTAVVVLILSVRRSVLMHSRRYTASSSASGIKAVRWRIPAAPQVANPKLKPESNDV